MKKILILLIAPTMVACVASDDLPKAENTKLIEKIVEVDRRTTNEIILDYYFEPADDINLTKQTNESFLSIGAYKGALYLVVETDNGGTKTYAIQKVNLQTKEQSTIISGLTVVSNIAFHNDYILVPQEDSVKVFNLENFNLELTIGKGTTNNFKIEHPVKAVFTTERHLIVRDEKVLRFYDLNDITPANDKKVPLLVKSGVYSANEAYVSVLRNELFLHRVLNSNKMFETYNLNTDGLINDGQTVARTYTNNPRAAFKNIVIYNGASYVIHTDGTFSKISLEDFSKNRSYTPRFPVDNFAIFDDVIYAISKDQSTILTYQRENMVYGEYE